MSTDLNKQVDDLYKILQIVDTSRPISNSLHMGVLNNTLHSEFSAQKSPSEGILLSNSVREVKFLH